MVLVLNLEGFFINSGKSAFELTDGVFFAAFLANKDSIFIKIFVVADECFAIFVRAKIAITFRKELRGNV